MFHTPVKIALPVLLLLASAPAGAQTPPSVPRIPVDLPESFSIRDFGTDLEPVCTAVYLNETTTTGFYTPVGANVELADDLHTTLTVNEAICGFDLGYFNPGVGNVDATVTLYANGEFDPDKGAIVAGPYVVHGLPPGPNAFHIEVVGGIVTPHVWMGVSFNDGITGLLSFGPPTVGVSHEVVWITPPNVPATFGGQPPADLFLGVHASPTTPVRPATWGQLKAHYR